MRSIAHGGQQVGIAHQVGDLELQQAGLARAEHFTGAAQFEVFFGNDKTVVGFAHDAQALATDLRQWRMIEQHAVAGGTAPANPPAQLVQLRQAQAFGVFDDHQTGVGDVHAHFNHGGSHQ